MFDYLDIDYNSGAEAATDSTTEIEGYFIPPASECLRCGLCVSGCPTFRLFQSNEETPRQRLRSISKVLQQQPLSTAERQHLDNCLQCRACESVCPSKMQFGALFDQTQQRLAKPAKGLAKLAFAFITHPLWLRYALPLLSVYLQSGIAKPLRQTGWLRRLHLAEAEALLSRPHLSSLATRYATKSNARGTVALFTGCIAPAFDRATLLAGIKLLNAMGYHVVIPKQQGCCGAIHQHHGQSASAFIANNLAVFNALEVDAVLHCASGCGAMLHGYPQDDSAASTRFHARLYDLQDFLLQHWPQSLQLQPCQLSVAVHEPCSQRNVLRNSASVYALLAKIPGLQIAALADNHSCCGAGGSYMLTHPENAAQLRQLKQQHIRAACADKVLSSNFGCALYLNAAPETTTRVLHPLVLLAEQL